MTERVLVTGAQGFIGRHVVAALCDSPRRPRILGIGRSAREASWGTPATGPGHDYLQVDLLDARGLRQVLERFQPDCVIHLASALRGEPKERLDRVNVEGVRSLLASLPHGPGPRPRLILASSGGIYGAGDDSRLPFPEDAPANPLEPYAASKWAMEQLATHVQAQRGGEVVVARVFNVVGPGQDQRHLCGKVAWWLAANEVDPRIEPLALGPLEATRDYVDVRDVAAALLLLAYHENPPPLVNVCSGMEVSGRWVLRELLRIAGVDDRRVVVAHGLPAGASRHCGLPVRMRGLGWKPAFTLDRSLEDLWQWTRASLRARAGR